MAMYVTPCLQPSLANEREQQPRKRDSVHDLPPIVSRISLYGSLHNDIQIGIVERLKIGQHALQEVGLIFTLIGTLCFGIDRSIIPLKIMNNLCPG